MQNVVVESSLVAPKLTQYVAYTSDKARWAYPWAETATVKGLPRIKTLLSLFRPIAFRFTAHIAQRVE
jgi:hypothetical protein